VAIAALVSVLTSPISAVWFALFAPLVMFTGTVVVAIGRRDAGNITVSAGLGLFAGPALYLLLAVLR
jgi:hypothetical protein